ncbi:MAG: malto-oligosyltrehalose synthase [Cellvibrionaceae bacterium]|nr:malto-oligosyltrehalose synthase [Cellvibrionaceae bacterium]
MTEIRASVRLQFHRDFTFSRALLLVPYFASLGVSHIYASPILKARPGSTHGYDVVDPSCVNPELGGEEGLEQLVAELRRHRMGLIVDFVPNHMAVGGDANPWWLDVLEWGRRSPYAKFFDIHWNSPDPMLKGQCLVPFLGGDYGDVLSSGDIQLRYSAQSGTFYAQYFAHRFPIYPPSYVQILSLCDHDDLQDLARRFAQLENAENPWKAAHALQKELRDATTTARLEQYISAAIGLFQIAEIPSSEQKAAEQKTLEHQISEHTASEKDAQIERLHQLLEAQNYRLASWRTAADDINWRRFFDINELAGLRMERHEVFEAVHAKTFELITRGLIDGLRIDHIDGLANPRAYCRKLQRRIRRLLPRRPHNTGPLHFPIYVEKILAAGERLQDSWQVEGTTGYEFMNQVNLLQHYEEGGAALTRYWQEFSGRPEDFNEEVLEARRLILNTSLSGDFEAVAQNLLLIARSDIHTRDLTLAAIRRALTELIVNFPAYRTYAGACERTSQDQVFFNQALEGAQRTLSETEWPVLQKLDSWLGAEPLHSLPPGPDRALRARTLARFQQLTSPTAAKAVEDTACYRSTALLGRNDVGFDPQHHGISRKDFHQLCMDRHARFPRSMLTTATHDHKRGEDTRARLAVLSERADWFWQKLNLWQAQMAPLREQLHDGTAPSPGDEWMLMQTLLGSWPLDYRPYEEAGEHADRLRDNYFQRLEGWLEKALREAKLRSSWSAPNSAYEQACRRYLHDLFYRQEMFELRCEIARAALEIAPAGALNGLAQTLLRLTAPGVPDLFQGTEFWDFSLVDPDNRRPVDFAARAAALAQGDSAAQLLQNWRDGRIKQRLIACLLNHRQAAPDLFIHGEYQPLTTSGEYARHCLAYMRVWQNERLLVIVPRLIADLLDSDAIPQVAGEKWGDTTVDLPKEIHSAIFTSVITRQDQSANSGHLYLRDVLSDFPVNAFIIKPTAQTV